MLNNFITYQKAKELYYNCRDLKLKGAMRDQLERASLSICLNLAEGSGKRTSKDRKRFYSIALGSLREVQAVLDILNQTLLIKQADEVGALVYRLNQNPGSLGP